MWFEGDLYVSIRDFGLTVYGCAACYQLSYLYEDLASPERISNLKQETPGG
jgi:hypothetical protein